MFGINKYGQELSEADLDRRHHRTYVGGMWDEIGRLQFNYLVAQGLQPGHTLLDIGCGALRGGLHFVRFLDVGHYAGMDVNRSLIDAAHRELAEAGLEDRQASLLVDDSFDFSTFNRTFDYMLAVSVFTHLPAELVLSCLVSARHYLKPGGRFYATVFTAGAGVVETTQEPGGITTCSDRDPFHFTRETLAGLAADAGLRLVSVTDWDHPRAQQMARFERLDAG